MLFEHPTLPSAIIRFSEPSCFDNFRAGILNNDANPATNDLGLKRRAPPRLDSSKPCILFCLDAS